MIVQVSPADDPRGPCPSISEFAVLRGMASVVAMNWSTRQAGIPVSVGPSNSIKIPGCGPRSDPRTLTPAEVEAWKAGLGRLKYAPQ